MVFEKEETTPSLAHDQLLIGSMDRQSSIVSCIIVSLSCYVSSREDEALLAESNEYRY